MATEVTTITNEEVEAPKLLWAQIYDSVLGPVAATYTSDPREIHDNGKPVYRYVLIDAFNTRQRAERAARKILEQLDNLTWAMLDNAEKTIADTIAAEFEKL